jgi:integrase/recombinase XerD
MRPRYQDPTIEIRGKRKYYCIRPTVDVLTEAGYIRRPKLFRLGFCDETTMTSAKKEKDRIMGPINSGTSLASAQIPFQKICDKFVTVHLPTIGASTADKYRSHIELYIGPDLGTLHLCDIDKPALQSWLNDKAEAGLGWNYRKDLRATVSNILERAREWGIFEGANPTKKLRIPGQAKREHRLLTSEQLQDFLAKIPETRILPAAHARLMVMVAVASGLRVSEILGLRPDSLDHAGKRVRVLRRWRRGEMSAPKTQKSRRVQKVGDLITDLAVLASGKQADELLFQRGGEGYDDRELQEHVFRPAAKAAGIYYEGFGMHGFRHLNITWRIQAGAEPMEAMKAAGHATLGMTYAYLLIDEKRDAAQVERIVKRAKGMIQ